MPAFAAYSLFTQTLTYLLTPLMVVVSRDARAKLDDSLCFMPLSSVPAVISVFLFRSSCSGYTAAHWVSECRL